VPAVGADSACVERRLAALKAELPGAVEAYATIGIERSDEEVAAWKRAAASALGLWTAFRDARCDAGLLRFEGGREDAATCRLRIGRTILGDFQVRYHPEQGGVPRKNVESLAAARDRKGPDEEGPCVNVKPAECDYCAMNHCWEARLKADDAALNAAWRTALARIAAKPGLAAGQRADWAERLRKAQRAWLRWRDEACALERLETPNPNAHSIYALVTAPCVADETQARIAALRRAYGR
jgi:uncharacterized protein YecT (DUF1311 family)